MDNWVVIVVGFLLVIIGYLIGIRQKVKLVHSYHYKRVTEENKKLFCIGVGLGNAITGVGLIIFSIVNELIGSTIAICTGGTLATIGFIVAIVTIIRFNKGLF